MFVQRLRSWFSRLRGTSFSVGLLVLTLTLFDPSFSTAQTTTQQNASPTLSKAASSTEEESEDAKQERLVAERFLELLLKRPRPGTALDKVYGYYVQSGTLDKFCDDLQSKAATTSSGEAWLLLGLVQSQRARDADALISLQKAEELLPDDPMASYYYGRTLARINNTDQAAAAMHRAIERKPSKADLLLVLQDLGRLYQRMGRAKEATEVWKNLEESFPGDSRVREQIASILAEEGATAEALVRYEQLAETTKDRFRKVELSLWAAQLKETLGRRDDALADFESLLGQVNPDSWMYQDLRNRIDRVFTSRNEYDALAKYYERWVTARPEDVDGMLRIGRLLSNQRRTPEAKEWFTKAMDRAPTNPVPRLALVDAYERERQFASAVQTMQTLVELDPDNVDHLVRLGTLIFANQDIPETERARSAADVWNKLLEKRSEDPLTVSRVADLLRGVKLAEEAIAAYRKAIALADNEPQYREYLGEYLFSLGRKDEALIVWRELASGPRESRDNLVRLSEVLATFHLDEEALSTMARACADKPTFDHRIRYAKMLRRAEKYDEAVKQLESANLQAESAEERLLVIDQQIETFQANGQLFSKIAELESAISATEKENPTSWQRLALYQEADRRFHQSAASIARAIELTPQSSVLLTIEARVREKAGLYHEAIESLRRLAALDRRFMSNHLMQMASLQMRVGQMKAAVATGQELISGVSANSEHFKFFADLCFKAGEDDLGLKALRQNVQRNPNDRDALRSLASKLAYSEDGEAIELYWRAYAASSTIDEKRNDIQALTPIYQRRNQFEQMISRLSNLGQELRNQRETTLLTASARIATGDLRSARALLDSLVTDQSRDVDVLNTLIQISAAEYDWDAAVRYQRQLNTSAPSREGELRLAKFLTEKGEIDEPLAIWTQRSKDSPDAERVTQIAELLIKNRRNDKAVEYAQQALARDPENWEIVAAAMCIMWRAEAPVQARAVADRLLKLKMPFDTPAAQYQKSSAAGAIGGGMQAPATGTMDLSSRSAWLNRFMINYTAIMSPNSPSSMIPRTFTINSFGDATLIAMFLSENGASISRTADGRLQFRPTATQRFPGKVAELAPNPSADEVWELIAKNYCVQRFGFIGSTNIVPLDTLLERLIELGDDEAPGLYLDSQHYRRLTGNDPLSNSVLTLSRSNNSWLYSSTMRAQLTARPSTGGRIGSTLSAGGPVQPNPTALSTDELERLSRLFEQSLAKTKNPHEHIAYLLWLAEENRKSDLEINVKPLVARAKELAGQKFSMEQLAAFLPFDREFAINKFTDCFTQQPPTQAARATSLIVNVSSPYSLYATSMFLRGLLDSSSDPNEIVELCSAIKDAQTAAARMLTPSQLSTYDPNRKISLYSYRLNGGASAFSNTVLPLPSESALQPKDLLTALYYVQQSGSADVKNAVKKRFAEDAEAPDEEALKSAIDRLCYATWLWWEGKKDDAIEQMHEFRKLGIASDVGSLIASQMLVENYKAEEAIELLDSLNPTNPRTLEYRELTVMNLALKNGNTDRAKTAVERLFSMPLNGATQLRVSAAMEQLGLHDLSEAVVKRLRRGGANDIPTMFQLMTRLSKSESPAEKADAVDLAWKIYQRTQPKSQVTPPGRSLTAQSTDIEYRTTALRLLIKSGETDKLIKSLEERLGRAPKNEPLVHQLAELYRETGKSTQADQMLKPYMPIAPNVAFSQPQIPQPLSAKEVEEQAIAKEVKTRVVLLGELMAKTDADWDELIKRLKSELFQTTSDSRLIPINAKVASALLYTEPPAWRTAKGKLQEWLDRAGASNEGKEKLKLFLKQTEKREKGEWDIAQLAILACIANAADDKEAARRIAGSIISHPNATSSVAALESLGRETIMAVVPVAMKLDDADLAVKLAEIAMKPTADTSTEALQLRLQLATLQIQIGKSMEAESTLRDIIAKLNARTDKDLQARSDLAMKIATVAAADKNLFEVSCEATLHASLSGTTGSQKRNEEIFKVVQLLRQNAPPDRAYATVKEVVLRSGDPNRWRLYPEPTRNYGGSHDFSFPDSDSKPLALVLVELAQANHSLPELIREVDAFADKPVLRIAALAMKAYSMRTEGKSAEAAKVFDEAIDSPKSVPEEMLLLCALTSPVPGGDESTVVPHETTGPLLKRFLTDRILRTGTRMVMLSQIKQCIATNDQNMLDCYVSAVADAIPKISTYDEQSLKLMLSQFYKSLAGECTAQGKAELAAEYLQRANAK